jgi:tRNA 5-methylaminomethyl-2-thiouridine biosynthesis bifunctional protein
MNVPGLHQLRFLGGRVVLHLFFGSANLALDRIRTDVNAWIVPSEIQSNVSETAVSRRSDWIRKIARLSVLSSELLVEDASEIERAALQASGFRIETASCEFGISEKRTVLCGSFQLKPRRRSNTQEVHNLERSAIVVGGGLAGTSITGALLRRGWEVSLVERHHRPAQEASGNLAGVFSPMISRDDGLAARLSRACFLWLRKELEQLEGARLPVRWNGAGVIQLAKDGVEEELFERIQNELQFDAGFVRRLSREEAEILVGGEVEIGGVVFPKGGWVNPPSLCEARLTQDYRGSILRRIFGREVSQLRWEGETRRWCVLDSHDQLIAEAPVVVLANGFEASRFEACAHLRFKKVRGQVTHLPEALLGRDRGVFYTITRDGYVTPSMDGMMSLGATYDFDSEDMSLREGGHESNLERFCRILPGALPKVDLEELGGRVGFRSLTPDRLPVVGEIADLGEFEGSQNGAREGLGMIARVHGLYGLLGMGSRGLVWSGLMGEFLAAKIEGEPLPIEFDLAESVDPARFLFRGKRR